MELLTVDIFGKSLSIGGIKKKFVRDIVILRLLSIQNHSKLKRILRGEKKILPTPAFSYHTCRLRPIRSSCSGHWILGSENKVHSGVRDYSERSPEELKVYEQSSISSNGSSTWDSKCPNSNVLSRDYSYYNLLTMSCFPSLLES